MAEKRYHEIKRVDQEIRRYKQTEEPPSRYLGKGPLIPGHPEVPMNPILEYDLDKLAPGRKGERSETYPPIVTIDGRVDTDIDHLIDDIADDYTGPVDEIPSKYPKPHVFSVVNGSLDDDVDSYANDDGTMEHTLVDAPKNFNPRDLKDVASPERNRRSMSQSQTERDNSNRSYNKMYVEPPEHDTIGEFQADTQSASGEEDEVQTKKWSADQLSRDSDNSEEESLNKLQEIEAITGLGAKGEAGTDGSGTEIVLTKPDTHTPLPCLRSDKYNHSFFGDQSPFSDQQELRASASGGNDIPALNEPTPKAALSLVPTGLDQCLNVSSTPSKAHESSAQQRINPIGPGRGQFHSCNDLANEEDNADPNAFSEGLHQRLSHSTSDLNSATELSITRNHSPRAVKESSNYFHSSHDPLLACHLETLEMRCVSDSDSFSKGSDIFLGRNYVDSFNLHVPSKGVLKEYYQSCHHSEVTIPVASVDCPPSSNQQFQQTYCADMVEQKTSSVEQAPCTEADKSPLPVDLSHYPTEEMKRQQVLKSDENDPYANQVGFGHNYKESEQITTETASPRNGSGSKSPNYPHETAHSLSGNLSTPAVSNHQQQKEEYTATDIRQGASDTCKPHTNYAWPSKKEISSSGDPPRSWVAGYDDYQSEFLRKELSQESGMGPDNASRTERDLLTKDSGDMSEPRRSPKYDRDSESPHAAEGCEAFSKDPLSIKGGAQQANKTEEETDSETLDPESYSLLCKLKAINDDTNKSQYLLRHVRQILQDSEQKRGTLRPSMEDQTLDRKHYPLSTESLGYEQKQTNRKKEEVPHNKKGDVLAIIGSEKYQEEKEVRQSKHVIGEKKERNTKREKVTKHTGGEKGSKTNTSTSDKGNKSSKRTCSEKVETAVVPLYPVSDAKDKKYMQIDMEEDKSDIKNITQGKANKIICHNPKRVSPLNCEPWTLSDEEDYWYQKPVWYNSQRVDPNMCAPCLTKEKRRNVPSRMYNTSKFMMEEGMGGAMAQRMKYAYDYYDTTSLASSETLDVYSEFSALESESSVPSHVHKRLLDSDRRSISIPRKMDRPPASRRWQSPDPYTEVQRTRRKYPGDSRHREYTKCTVKTSLRAAIKVAEESMSAAARVAEALNIVMRAGKMVSPVFSPSSTSEDNRKHPDKSNDRNIGAMSKSRRSNPLPPPRPESKRGSQTSTKKAHSTDRQSTAKEKIKRPGSPVDKKKRSSSMKPLTVGPAQQAKIEQKKVEEPENGPTRPEHKPQELVTKTITVPDTKEKISERKASGETVPKSETNIGLQPVLSGTSKACCSQHVCSRGPQVTIHIAYPKSDESSSRADKHPCPNESGVQDKAGQGETIENQEGNRHSLVEPELDIHPTRSQEGELSPRSQEHFPSRLEMGDVPRPAESDVLPSDSQKSKDWTLKNESHAEDDDNSVATDVFENAMPGHDWTIPLSRYSGIRRSEGYFGNAQPVIDPNLQGLGLGAKRFYRSQLKGSCVDPFGDSHGSDTDSIEYNANFNKAPRDLHRKSSISSCSDDQPDIYPDRDLNSQRNQSRFHELHTSFKCSQFTAWARNETLYHGTRPTTGIDDWQSAKDSDWSFQPSFNSHFSDNNQYYSEQETVISQQIGFTSNAGPCEIGLFTDYAETKGTVSLGNGPFTDSKDPWDSTMSSLDTSPCQTGPLMSQADNTNRKSSQPASNLKAEIKTKPLQAREVSSQPAWTRSCATSNGCEECRPKLLSSPPRYSFLHDDGKQPDCANEAKLFNCKKDMANPETVSSKQVMLTPEQEDSVKEQHFLSLYLGQDQATAKSISSSQPKLSKGRAKLTAPGTWLRQGHIKDREVGPRQGRDSTRRMFSPIYEDTWREDHHDSGSNSTDPTGWSHRPVNNKNSNNNEGDSSEYEEERDEDVEIEVGGNIEDNTIRDAARSSLDNPTREDEYAAGSSRGTALREDEYDVGPKELGEAGQTGASENIAVSIRSISEVHDTITESPEEIQEAPMPRRVFNIGTAGLEEAYLWESPPHAIGALRRSLEAWTSAHNSSNRTRSEVQDIAATIVSTRGSQLRTRFQNVPPPGSFREKGQHSQHWAWRCHAQKISQSAHN